MVLDPMLKQTRPTCPSRQRCRSRRLPPRRQSAFEASSPWPQRRCRPLLPAALRHRCRRCFCAPAAFAFCAVLHLHTTEGRHGWCVASLAGSLIFDMGDQAGGVVADRSGFKVMPLSAYTGKFHKGAVGGRICEHIAHTCCWSLAAGSNSLFLHGRRNRVAGSPCGMVGPGCH